MNRIRGEAAVLTRISGQQKPLSHRDNQHQQPPTKGAKTEFGGRGSEPYSRSSGRIRVFCPISDRA